MSGKRPTTDQLRGMIGPQLDYPIPGTEFEDGKPRIHVWSSDAVAIAEYLNSHDELLEALDECEAYLSDREDVIDGSYGEPAPNKEMTLLIQARAALAKARGQS